MPTKCVVLYPVNKPISTGKLDHRFWIVDVSLFYNMFRKLLVIVLFGLFFLSKPVFAYEFKVTSIGEITVGSALSSKIWRKSTKPIIRGTATPGANISVSIDGTALQVSADSAGNWTFTPQSTLSAADHTIKVTNVSNSVEQTTTVAAGSTVDANTQTEYNNGGIKTLPRTGGTVPTLLLLGFGSALICIGGKYLISL